MASSVGQPNANLACSNRAASHDVGLAHFGKSRPGARNPQTTKALHVLLISV